ncbi:MAG: hypothetical protein EP338_12950 [Bacteroidetes bacterium]|nr:MAG: hypothetical protein EP338_12950 [Bacteroidota bacterium]
MRRYLFFVCLVAHTCILAQSGKLKKADAHFSRIAYASAAEIYEQLLGTRSESSAMVSRLAYCYYQMGQVEEAEIHYRKLVELTGSTFDDTLDYFNFAQVLKQNGKYRESDVWMKKYHKLSSEDSRAREFIQNENYIQQIERSGNKFTVDHLNFNSKEADFGGYQIQNQVYFVSGRTDHPQIKKNWAWNNMNFLDLYTIERDTGNTYGSPKIFTKRVNTKFHEGPICFTPDGKRVFFTRNNIASGPERKDKKGIQNLKLYIADVVQNDIWLNEREFKYNSKEYSIGHPSVSADGKELYFVSDMPGGYGGADIYRVQILENGEFGKPENLGETINTEGQDMFPWINQEGLLFFSSDGHTGLGGLDIYVGLPNRSGTYTRILNVGKPVNSSRDDFAFIMDQSSVKGYFSSNRPGGEGSDDIYAYRLESPIRKGLIIDGVVKDAANKNAIYLAKVLLKDSLGNILAEKTSDSEGYFEFEIDPDNQYTVEVQKEKFFTNMVSISTKEVPEDGVIKTSILLDEDTGISLFGTIVDAETRRPIENVKVGIEDFDIEQNSKDYLTDQSGLFNGPVKGYKVGDELNYKITLEKEGYYKKMVLFSYPIEKLEPINIQQYLNVSMDRIDTENPKDSMYYTEEGNPIKEGGDLAELIDIKPIYFDLNKYNIRSDAAVELNKIVEIMNKYPGMVVELGSHTDCRGSKAYNARLSDRRAKASANYIKKRISNPERIYGKGYGESKLITNCPCEGSVKSSCSEEEHQKNRRTEFLIIKLNQKVKVRNAAIDKR